MEDNVITNPAWWVQTSSLRDMLSGLRQRKEAIKLKYASAEQNNRINSSLNLYENSQSATNKQLQQQYNIASRWDELAWMIVEYGKSKGVEIKWTTKDILNTYLRWNPNRTQAFYDYTHWNQDSEEFAMQMWWIEKDWWDKLWDFTKNAGQNFLSFYESWGDAVRNTVNGLIWLSEWDQTPWALENYAQMNYWKDFYSLSETEKAEARQAVSSQEWMDMYKPTAQRVALKSWEAWLDALFTAVAPRMKAWFSVAWAGAEADIPVVSDVLGYALWWLDKVNNFLWWIVTEVPWLSNFRDSLQTEQEKEEFDNFLWMIVLWKIMQKRWWRVKNSRSLKETVINELDPITTIKEFQKRVQEAPSDIKEWIGSLGDGKATPEKLQDTAWKIANTKSVQESERATRWLKDLDTEWIKTYKDLEERLTARWNEIAEAENLEYAKDTTRYKPEQTRSKKTMEQDWYTAEYEVKPIEDWIELLKDFYEWNPEKMAQLNVIEQKFQNEWLTKWEINNISRAISSEYETYKSRWEPKTNITAKDVEWIRQRVKDFAREGNDRLVELDKQWSDNMNTRQMIRDVQDQIVKAKNNLADRNILQKLWGGLWALADMLWWWSFLRRLLRMSGEWDKSLNAIQRQKNLKSYLKKFQRLNKRLESAKTEKQVEKAVNEFNNDIETTVLAESKTQITPK